VTDPARELTDAIADMNVRSVEDARRLIEAVRDRAEHVVAEHELPRTDPFRSAEEWINDPRFFGGKNLRPKIREHFIEIFEEQYLGALCRWGKGGGKSYMAGACAARMGYEVLVGLRDGWLYEVNGLEPGTPVFVPIISVSQKQAQKAVFHYAQQFIEGASWFGDQFPVVATSTYLTFTDWNGRTLPIQIHAATSEDRGILGEAVYGYVLDEFDFFPETITEGGLRRAEELDLLAFTQMLSRFPQRHGRAVRITSPSWSGGVATTMMERLRDEEDGSVYVSTAAAWELDDMPHEEWREYCEPPLRVPKAYWPAFDLDAEASKRHVGAIPSAALQPFDALAEKIVGGAGGTSDPEPPPPDGRGPDPNHPNPVVRIWEGGGDDDPILEIAESFQPKPDAEYFAHFDYSTTGNATGIAMCHPEFDPHALEDDDDKVRVVVDLSARILPQEVGGRINFERCRQLLYALRDRGFNIVLASADGFESEDTRQILSARGFQTALVSVDKKREPYGTLKGLIHGRKLVYGTAYWCHEYRHLEDVKGARVDHGPNGSKDAADAVAGSSYMAALHGRQTVGAEVVAAPAGEKEAREVEKWAARGEAILEEGLKKVAELSEKYDL
jgi:hypothetical protein